MLRGKATAAMMVPNLTPVSFCSGVMFALRGDCSIFSRINALILTRWNRTAVTPHVSTKRIIPAIRNLGRERKASNTRLGSKKILARVSRVDISTAGGGGVGAKGGGGGA